MIMVQEFYVLKCHSCELFQVHIVKKAKKWECKVCGQKQSIVKIFGQGSAKDCRILVQKLNEQRGQNAQTLNENYDQFDRFNEPDTVVRSNIDHSVDENAKEKHDSSEPLSDHVPNKWQKYLESDETDELSDDTNFQNSFSSCRANSLQPHEIDGLDQPVSKTFRFSRNNVSMDRKMNVLQHVAKDERNSSQALLALPSLDTIEKFERVEELLELGSPEVLEAIDEILDF